MALVQSPEMPLLNLPILSRVDFPQSERVPQNIVASCPLASYWTLKLPLLKPLLLIPLERILELQILGIAQKIHVTD